MSDSDGSFAALLRGHRVRRTLTQELLAERTGISAAAIAALEQGRRTAPRLSTVRLIAEALELPAAELGVLARAASAAGMAQRADHTPPSGISRRAACASPPHDAQREERRPAPGAARRGECTSETGAIAQVVLTERLVTLVGPRGAGKTRLARAVAAGIRDKFAGGTWWVELGSVGDPAGVPAATLRALGLADQPPAAAGEQLLAGLPDDPMLLVLDGCEHVLDAAATLAAGLLVHPSVSVLATSREALAVPGEVRWPAGAPVARPLVRLCAAPPPRLRPVAGRPR